LKKNQGRDFSEEAKTIGVESRGEPDRHLARENNDELRGAESGGIQLGRRIKKAIGKDRNYLVQPTRS